MAHQIVVVPGVVIGECFLCQLCISSCLCEAAVTDYGLVCAGKYGSNIRPAFWRNIPLFLAPFWAASLLFSRAREMPVVTADKVSFPNNKPAESGCACINQIPFVLDRFQPSRTKVCCLGRLTCCCHFCYWQRCPSPYSEDL